MYVLAGDLKPVPVYHLACAVGILSVFLLRPPHSSLHNSDLRPDLCRSEQPTMPLLWMCGCATDLIGWITLDTVAFTFLANLFFSSWRLTIPNYLASWPKQSAKSDLWTKSLVEAGVPPDALGQDFRVKSVCIYENFSCHNSEEMWV